MLLNMCSLCTFRILRTAALCGSAARKVRRGKCDYGSCASGHTNFETQRRRRAYECSWIIVLIHSTNKRGRCPMPDARNQATRYSSIHCIPARHHRTKLHRSTTTSQKAKEKIIQLSSTSPVQTSSRRLKPIPIPLKDKCSCSNLRPSPEYV
jgi:hypothetical protein